MTLRNINSIVASLSPYKPGKPIEELSRELGLTDIVKLASNENPLGASGRVKAALALAVEELARYPDGSGFALKKALSEKLKVEPHQITLGNGSNDVLDLIARATIDSEAEGIISEHSFVVYGLSIKCAGGRTVIVPASNYGCDLQAMAQAVTDLIEQGAPAFEAAVPVLTQLLKAEMADECSSSQRDGREEGARARHTRSRSSRDGSGSKRGWSFNEPRK